MFTGIIEALGTLAHTEEMPGGGRRLQFTAPPSVLQRLSLGASIAIDGVCTTVVDFTETDFSVEASPETLHKTTFDFLTPGTPVNLETPLTMGAQLGGHWVTGHVDGLAQLTQKTEDGNSWVLRYAPENHQLMPLLVEKGSVAIAGISLTVNTVDKTGFTVAIIPHTSSVTNILNTEVGQLVNIETDILGKYVLRMLEAQKPSGKVRDGLWFNMEERLGAPQ